MITITAPRSARRAATGRRRALGARRGFTMVELIVAIIILTVGVLGLASTAAVVSRMIGGGALQAQAANVAQSRFERLRQMNSTCANITSGSAITRRMTETWTVTPAGARAVSVTLTVTYKGASYDRVRGTYNRTQTYRSMILCD